MKKLEATLRDKDKEIARICEKARICEEKARLEENLEMLYTTLISNVDPEITYYHMLLEEGEVMARCV